MSEYRRQTPANSLQQDRPRLHRRAAVRKWVRWLLVGLLLLGLAAYLGVQLSPYPKALLIRYGFDKGAVEIAQKLEKHVPPGVTAILNEPYRSHDNDALLDVFYPQALQSSAQVLPTIVWIHGGAWISGNKSHVANYLKILASHGYTAVGVGYSIAPEHQYPTPLIQINDALNHLQQQAKRLHIDPNRFVLAGDSAGAQMASQMAAIVTNPAYASTLGIRPALQPSQLKATLLNCGAYDPKSVNYNGSFGSFLQTVMWSYSGTKAFLTDPNFQSFAVINYVTKNFPPSFITAGNADPLAPQSIALAQKLTQAGVRTDTLFYPNDHTPPLEHEYQFNLDLADGQQALKRILAFLQTALK
ncbi:MAG: alpha/beta hydrolase [Tildeniella nuda ZEHNDER 1965/U140]|jgi:acetyl esterase/lipase|nr:alpha/beta hydrolase [Tildeniella nuda ZEHNDER 1965/U140]